MNVNIKFHEIDLLAGTAIVVIIKLDINGIIEFAVVFL